MADPSTCSSCNAALPSDAELAGVCLACAFDLALTRQIGPYRLLEPIGRGGMGEVWLAEQTEPVRRRVAVKLIKAGMDTKQVIVRFQAERQALAMMDHPCVANMLDAGETEDGKPFFVMEYVPGLSITEHCDRHNLTTAERLALFLQVCDAIQHAHRRTILHRDLKPSNVLVSVQDGVARPKVIDFGVAKAMEQPLTERTLQTEAGAVLGTPEYMSPEQASLGGSDVDTRTDVYGLGVLLYELLVGALPFEPRELRQAGLDGILRTIREVEPPRPSNRLITLPGERSSQAARQRGVDLPTLRRQVAGEIDWITMRALEKDRERRYGSAAELAADVRRHLQHEPVLAGPPSAIYRARKFARRHRVGVGAGLLVVLAVAGFAAAMAVQASRIAREAEAKHRVSAFLTELLAGSDPAQARGRTVTAREILDKGVAKIRGALREDPTVRGDLLMTMGTAYASLGLYPQAEPLLHEAFDTRRRVLGPKDPDTLLAASERGRVLCADLRDKEAEPLLVSTLALQREALGPEHVDTLRTMGNLARAYWGEERHIEAEALFRKALPLERRVLGPDHVETLRTMQGLGLAIQSQGRFKEAEAIFLDTLAHRRRVLGPEHPHTLNTMMHLSFSYQQQNRPAEAEALYRQMLEIGERVLGPRHFDMIWGRYNMASWAAEGGRSAEALDHLRRAVDHGFSDASALLDAPEFKPLLGRREFQAVVEAARENAKSAGKQSP